MFVSIPTFFLGCAKLSIDKENLKNIVLNSDGTEVDDDDILLTLEEPLIFLLSNEEWNSNSASTDVQGTVHIPVDNKIDDKRKEKESSENSSLAVDPISPIITESSGDKIVTQEITSKNSVSLSVLKS